MRPALLAVVAFLPSIAAGAGVHVSGGLDGRLRLRDGNAKAVLEGAFLNARKVFRDEQGDRVIAVAQADADDNFERIRPYQTYLQYKGALGRWNLRAGHYLLPFGLLAYYDTERLLLRTIEYANLGIKLDTGIQTLGYWGSWDYAVSVSEGMGRRRLSDADGNKVVTGRIGWWSDETRVGLSAMSGDVLPAEEVTHAATIRRTRRAALDASIPWEQWTARAELAGGTDDGRDVGGGFLGLDAALHPDLEANMKYSHWERAGSSTDSVGAGLSYRFRPGLFFRIADEQEFAERRANTVTGQVYYEFSKTLF